ncbi:MAG: SDR family oxidoreductase [Candidatus Cybelea sp.]
MELAGKAAIVTGAGGGGSGRAIAKRFARGGAVVVVSDVHEAGGAQTIAEIAHAGGRAVYRRVDVRSEEEVRDLVAFAECEFGGLSVMVNNASGPEFHFDRPLEFWKEIVETELLGTMYGVRYALEAMGRSGGGAIVNVSSTSALEYGRLRPGGLPAYDAAKAGVVHLTTMLRFLGETDAVRLNCVVPHWIASPLRLATDERLAGRALILWGGRKPALIPIGDRGYEALEPLPIDQRFKFRRRTGRGSRCVWDQNAL